MMAVLRKDPGMFYISYTSDEDSDCPSNYFSDSYDRSDCEKLDLRLDDGEDSEPSGTNGDNDE